MCSRSLTGHVGRLATPRLCRVGDIRQSCRFSPTMIFGAIVEDHVRGGRWSETGEGGWKVQRLVVYTRQCNAGQPVHVCSVVGEKVELKHVSCRAMTTSVPAVTVMVFAGTGIGAKQSADGGWQKRCRRASGERHRAEQAERRAGWKKRDWRARLP
jgi:hypothetical protein